MERRALTAAAATAGGLALLLSFKTPARPTTRPSVTAPFGNGSTPSSTRATGPTSNASSPTTGQTSTTRSSSTVTGPVVSTRYGDVQVQATIRNGRLTDATAVALPDEGRSAEISQEAEPILRSEAASAHSANIDTVSGATSTSEAYVESLQAALDRGGA